MCTLCNVSRFQETQLTSLTVINQRESSRNLLSSRYEVTWWLEGKLHTSILNLLNLLLKQRYQSSFSDTTDTVMHLFDTVADTPGCWTLGKTLVRHTMLLLILEALVTPLTMAEIIGWPPLCTLAGLSPYSATTAKTQQTTQMAAQKQKTPLHF